MGNGTDPVRRGLRGLLGSFQGQAPPWVSKLDGVRRERPRRFWGTIAALLLLPVLIMAGLALWQLLPQPVLTRVEVEPPGVTRVGSEGELYPQPLVLNFRPQFTDARQEGSRGAARLELLGKTLTEGVALKPGLPGEWRWTDANTLRFEPAEDWPAGQRYRVALEPSLFAAGVTLAEDRPAFTTPRIEATFTKLDFYQHPEKPSQHRVIATLRFTHAVDKASLREHLSATMRASGESVDAEPEPYDYQLELGKQGREAYVKTSPVDLPEQENFLTWTLEKGVAAALGPSTTGRTITGKVTVPAVTTFFRVDNLDTRIVRNEDNDPEQTLVLELTDAVKTAEVADRIRAWVLPAGRRWRRDDIDDALKRRSRRLELVGNPSEREYAKLQSFRFRAPENRQILVHLPAGLTSRGGFEMAVPHTKLLRAPRYPKEVSIAGEGSLLALSGDRILGLQARGVPGLQVEAFRLLDEQLVHLVTQTSGDISRANFKLPAYYFSEENIGERFQRVLPLEADSPAAAAFASVDLAPWLEGAGRGVFVVRVKGWDPERDRRVRGAEDRRLVLVTDLSVIAKDNADGSHDLFVHSLDSQEPVAGAQVALLGRNGQPVVTATTDGRGHATLPDVSDLDDEQAPAAYLVRHEGDRAFLPFDRGDRRLNYSRFATGGIRTGGNEEGRLRAQVFSDRGIYRPGESGHLGVLVKRDDWRPVADVPVAVTLTNPRGNVVREERVALPEGGFIEMPFAVAATDPTGRYRARVYLLDEEGDRQLRRLGETTLSVEEFQPDTLRINTVIAGGEARGWRNLERYAGRVSLQNLFGLPAQERRVQASYTLRPATFRFDRYPDYRFEDPFRRAEDRLEQEVTEQLPEAKTDAEGEAVFDIDLSRYGNGLFRLGFRAEGYESGGGRSVSARSATLVSPAERLVGWKADGGLDYLKRDAERTVRFLAVAPDLASVAAPDLTLEVLAKRKVSTLVRQDDGTLAYQTVTKRESVSERDFAIAEGGTDWRVPTAEPGDYVAELRDGAGHLLAKVGFNVAGARNLTGDLEQDAELDLQLDRSDYAAGERIEMEITAPYTGAGLITVERDGVYAFKWFRTDTTTSVQSIRVPEGLEGNGYVNVTFVRALDSEEIFTRPLSYAVAPFNVDRAARTVDVELAAPDKVKPGEALEIGFRTSRPGRIAVFAVDEGILQVADYATPRPLDTFLRKRALEVATAQMADLLMPEFRLLRRESAAGGGMDTGAAASEARAALGANLNPFQRGVQAPVTYWSGIREATGEQQSLRFTVPDHFDGELRLMAVASAAGAAGSAERRTLVRGPFVLQPSVITTAAPGDEFTVSVGVTNALPEDSGERAVEVRLDPGERLAVVGEATRTLSLKPGREGRARFRVRAGDEPGAAELTFRARSGERSLSRTASLSVRPAVPHRTTLNAGMGSGGEAEVALDRELRPALAEQEATLGRSPLILAGGLRQYLEGFPHGCTEQQVSRVFPVLGLVGDAAVDVDRAGAMERFREVLGTLRARQRPDGGFGFWPGAGRTDDFVSVYAMHFLTDADALGFPVPSQVRSTGLDYLRRIAGQQPRAGQRAFVQAYAAYVMTRNGKVTTNYLTRLQEYLEKERPETWRSSLTAAYMAAAYRQLQLEDLADELIGGYRFAEPGSDYPRDMDSALARNAQYVYLLARHFPERLAEVGDERLRRLVGPVSDNRYNTLSAAYTMLALGAWGQEAGAGGGPLAIAAPTGEDGAMAALAEGEPPVLRTPVPLGTPRLRFSGGDRRLFYTATQSGYDAELPDEPVRQGLEIVRELVDEEGNVVTTATQGDELTVRVRVRALDNRPHPNVAVVDLLPGGFEVQRDSVRNGKEGWATDYVDIREDRLVLYGTVTAEARTFTYRVKATGAGTFTVPPAFAESMYHPDRHARSTAGTFTVERP